MHCVSECRGRRHAAEWYRTCGAVVICKVVCLELCESVNVKCGGKVKVSRAGVIMLFRGSERLQCSRICSIAEPADSQFSR